MTEASGDWPDAGELLKTLHVFQVSFQKISISPLQAVSQGESGVVELSVQGK